MKRIKKIGIIISLLFSIVLATNVPVKTLAANSHDKVWALKHIYDTEKYSGSTSYCYSKKDSKYYYFQLMNIEHSDFGNGIALPQLIYYGDIRVDRKSGKIESTYDYFDTVSVRDKLGKSKKAATNVYVMPASAIKTVAKSGNKLSIKVKNNSESYYPSYYMVNNSRVRALGYKTFSKTFRLSKKCKWLITEWPQSQGSYGYYYDKSSQNIFNSSYEDICKSIKKASSSRGDDSDDKVVVFVKKGVVNRVAFVKWYAKTGDPLWEPED